jgi:NitT/TauT family transport system ATP-binding protein
VSAGAPEAAGALVIDNLSLVYQSTRGDLKALDRLSMSVARAEFVAVLGPSGCGKSTLLNVISGLLTPSQGSVTIAGALVTGPRPDVGIVFQQPTLLPWKTVRENVLVPIRALRRPVEDFTKKADELLDLVGLTDFAQHYPSELSGGMQQRVGLARGLIHDPAVLLMDEPFAALDAMTRENMMMELQSLWLQTRKSVVFITHSIPEAVFLADRVVVLSGRPARSLAVIDVGIGRPRALETMAMPAFTELCNHLRRLFGEMGPARLAAT